MRAELGFGSINLVILIEVSGAQISARLITLNYPVVV
jgi:hypothetical protein